VRVTHRHRQHPLPGTRLAQESCGGISMPHRRRVFRVYEIKHEYRPPSSCPYITDKKHEHKSTAMNKKRFLFIVAALFCILIGIYTLDFNRMATVKMLEPKPKQTSKDFMLSSLNVTSIAQDHNRLIWIGTSAGINLYNGKDYIQFFHDSKDSTALPDDYINALYCDKNGKMWVYTQNGVARYEGGYRFHRLNKTEKAPRLGTSRTKMVIHWLSTITPRIIHITL